MRNFTYKYIRNFIGRKMFNNTNGKIKKIILGSITLKFLLQQTNKVKLEE